MWQKNLAAKTQINLNEKTVERAIKLIEWLRKKNKYSRKTDKIKNKFIQKKLTKNID